MNFATYLVDFVTAFAPFLNASKLKVFSISLKFKLFNYKFNIVNKCKNSKELRKQCLNDYIFSKIFY